MSSQAAWTDKERLTYLFALIEKSNVKFDYNATPRPEGRTVVACQRMMERLKSTLKNELEALYEGRPIEERTPKKAIPTSTPRKRKAKAADADAESPTTPSKRGRKNKNKSEAVVEEDAAADADDERKEAGVKHEPKNDDEDEEEI
ncbi:hypothetical protein PtrSN002B_010577 [Pyrenophora tritici-repentis]|uniref:HMG17 domain containing protein n=2 Tax=Pyrenophora tritici-repentis TaxID=45151 RepID=A0A2W1HSP4_9PLEO|nr:uncharacterized protein PTRG_01842 [Pyrenophora tritici-repentis Pt-1C-BFP]KAA8626547.1 hypothetical protein PtrV1_02227 [Pyrenophora tritici-repentis]EDU41280.1 predicted protein [Pyrenophora tritici-repentis Pt-1C-BFP]KAF7454975.1 hypothetical protein A1F99_022330 [Pyrenophora tritici-repentis]KAF7578129.1 HMG17 domain containing protein [Pyrenophora tritici-repentis]KAG9388733.1 hypothetical protein A1F94_001626 [Pyrenophora tritici-repentis]